MRLIGLITDTMMNLLDQFESLASELQILSCQLRQDGAIEDSLELDDQVKSYREMIRVAPRSERSHPTQAASRKVRAGRSIDLLRCGCFETNPHGIIQRANEAASKLLSLPLPFITGQPLLVFVAQEDRRAFLAEFMNLRHGHGPTRADWLVRCKPLFKAPFLASFTGESVMDRDARVVTIIWIFSRVYPADTGIVPP
jgi:PAS domain-containing protein